MNEFQFRLSGMFAEVTVREAFRKPFNRNGGRNKLTATLNNVLTAEELLAHKKEVHSHSIGNTLRKFKRLLFSNFSHGYTFVTLTFDAKLCDFDITNTAICRTKFTNYWKNLKRGTKAGECLDENIDVRYLGVQEFHKDGSIHFHILCHIPRQYKALLKKKWQHGHIDFQRSNKKHRYLASLGLKQPKIFKFTSPSFPTWINEDNSTLIYKEESEYAFTYYQFITTLTEDEFQSYVESAKDDELQHLIEQMQMIQQLQPVA